MKILADALAIFSLFFGAGNAVFPILLGLNEKDYFVSSFAGLLVTGILLPCLGLVAVILYKGSLKTFFRPWGKAPRQILVALMAGLLGPLAVMPRCVLVAHASVEGLGVDIPLYVFSLLFSLLCFLCLWSRSRVFDLLGKILSPILVLSLLAIIVSARHDFTPTWSLDSFKDGFLVGYKTLDLVAALFFAPSVYLYMKGSRKSSSLVLSSVVAFILLALVYLGLASAAADSSLAGVKSEALLRELSKFYLGREGAYLACISVALACLTTVVGLTLSLNNWIFSGKKVSQKRERSTSFILLSICVLFSFLGFESIMLFLDSILSFLYPVLIFWTLYQIFTARKQAS